MNNKIHPSRQKSSPKRHFAVKALAVLSILALPLLQGQAMAADALRVAQQQDPQNLDPIDTFRLSWGSIGSNVFDGLIQRGEDIKLVPGLATQWQFLDDNKRIRFILRQGVKFHNGEPFNGQAVKYTFDRLLGEQGKKGPQRSNYTSIASVEVINDHTVDFHMEKVDPVILTKLAGYGAMIVPPKYIAEVGEKAFDMKPVGTGPFKVVQYKPAVSVQLERFDDYWNGRAKVKDLTIRFITEPATRIAELLSGGVDISLNIPTTAIETVEANDNVELYKVSGPTVRMLRFNTRDGITEDVRVRQAINMAIDKETIIKVLLKGFGQPISSAQSEKSFGFDPALKGYPYDPAKAKQLLKQAGIKPNTEIAIDIVSNNDSFREVAQVVGSYLNAVGLKVKIKSHEQNVYFSDTITKGKTSELYYYGWGGWTFDFDNTAYLLYHSGERNNPYINDEKLNQLLEGQRQTYDTQVREKALREVAAYVHDQAFDVPLYNIPTLYGVSKKVKGFVAAPDDRARYMNVSVD